MIDGGQLYAQDGIINLRSLAANTIGTIGTTGGAAYAIAVGSKLRRDAQFTFLTYRDGRPVGIQPVTVTTRGRLSVAPWVELDLASSAG